MLKLIYLVFVNENEVDFYLKLSFFQTTKLCVFIKKLWKFSYCCVLVQSSPAQDMKKRILDRVNKRYSIDLSDEKDNKNDDSSKATSQDNKNTISM